MSVRALRALALASLAACAARASSPTEGPRLIDVKADTRDLAAWFEREQAAPRALFLFSPV